MYLLNMTLLQPETKRTTTENNKQRRGGIAASYIADCSTTRESTNDSYILTIYNIHPDRRISHSSEVDAHSIGESSFRVSLSTMMLGLGPDAEDPLRLGSGRIILILGFPSTDSDDPKDEEA